MEEEINCMWLNKEYGKGYWICTGFLKPVNEEICKNCEERSREDVGKMFKMQI